MILPDLDEALRYCGVPKPDESLRGRMIQLVDRVKDELNPRSVWAVYSLLKTTTGVILQGTDLLLKGNTASRMLSGCEKAAVMVCTLGSAFDRLLREYQIRDISEALLLDGLGSAWVEAVCDQVENEMAAAISGVYFTDRFSPGYGDLPLDLQPGLLNALNAQRRTGVTVLPSNLMNPMKTVTALVGLSPEPQAARIRGCAYCRLSSTCALRKRGISCVSES